MKKIIQLSKTPVVEIPLWQIPFLVLAVFVWFGLMFWFLSGFKDRTFGGLLPPEWVAAAAPPGNQSKLDSRSELPLPTNPPAVN